MKKHVILAVLLSLPFGTFAADKPKDADNTDRNKQDRDKKTLTPTDQSNKRDDIKLTAAVRQALIKDKSLTSTAKNIKIITTPGKVTLRGPVTSAEEKARVEELAKGAAGQVPVESQLEIKAGK